MFEHSQISRWCLVIACVGFVSACGPNGSEGGQDSSYSVDSPEAFFKAFNDLSRTNSCEQRFKCPKRFGQPFFTTTFHNSLEACKSGGAPTGIDAQVEQDLEAGRINYNQQLAQKCINEFASKLDEVTSDCSAPPEVTGLSDECQDEPTFFEGTVEEGGSCRSDTACKGDNLECDVPTDACGGTCVNDGGSQPSQDPNKDKGASCEEDDECASELSCAPASGQSGKVCIEWYSRSDGSACDSDSDCKPQLVCRSGACTTLEILSKGDDCPVGITVDAVCEPGTACLETGSGTTTCQSFQEAGDSCDREEQCAGTLGCLQGTCTTIKAPGESCSSDAECGDRSCLSDDTCAPFGREACWESNSGQ